ncbi:MAG TPA: helix-turn-helix transcriptional regulator [Bryobacteraceae bacterium]|jgi:hypothetical protein|nr:helix-turn-helix transcriptional regulator [Bryobacteraceae bacterium]
MTNYAKWRDLEREFRELCREQPMIRAAETPDGWIVRTKKAVRFKALAGIAALNASGGSSTWNQWLDLVKAWLLQTSSELIDCIHATSAGGIEAQIPAAAKNIYHHNWPKILPDDQRMRRYTLCTINSICEASADYCLELARSSFQSRRRQKSAKAPLQGESSKHLAAERAERRQAVVDPILARKHWTRGQLATEAGVGKATVYGYFDGSRSRISQDNRKAIADCLGLPADRLPE